MTSRILISYPKNQTAFIRSWDSLKRAWSCLKGSGKGFAIGRLLAKEDANVLILDEPTAYLDPLAEIEMYNFIFALAKDRLVFYISHRLGFAKNADRIIVINQGELAEDGTHRQLMNTPNGLYAQMFEAQKEWYAINDT